MQEKGLEQGRHVEATNCSESPWISREARQASQTGCTAGPGSRTQGKDSTHGSRRDHISRYKRKMISVRRNGKRGSKTKRGLPQKHGNTKPKRRGGGGSAGGKGDSWGALTENNQEKTVLGVGFPGTRSRGGSERKVSRSVGRVVHAKWRKRSSKWSRSTPALGKR